MLQKIERQFEFRGGIVKCSPHVNEVMSLHLLYDGRFISIHEALDLRAVSRDGFLYNTAQRLLRLELCRFGYKTPRQDLTIMFGLTDDGELLVTNGISKHTDFIFKAKAKLVKPEVYIKLGLTVPTRETIDSIIRKERVLSSRRLLIKR